jgi:hypothetical protein
MLNVLETLMIFLVEQRRKWKREREREEEEEEEMELREIAVV